MKSKSICLFLGLFCLTKIIVFAQPETENAVINTIKIKDHIHLLQWSGAGNIMLLSGKDGNILIDDQFAPLSGKINSAIQAINPGQVKFLFNTHYHGDHSGGNVNFAKTGATIIAHANVRARLSGDSTKVTFAPGSKAEPQLAWPVITFNEGMNVYLNKEEVVVFHVDNAHTDGDALFYLPKSNVLHTGDCFMKDKFPFIDRNSGGSVNGWISAVSKVLTIIDDETVIIPGHGDLANKKNYRNIRDAVIVLYDAVKKNVKLGKNQEQILAMNLAKEYDSNFGNGFISGSALIETIFKELNNLK